MASSSPPSTTPSGRRKGATSTRDAILRAAIELFAARGYEHTTLRAITTKAGVDVALVSHFFGGKRGLFEEAVLQRREAVLVRLADATQSGSAATRLLDAYFEMWENDETAKTAQALFRAALESEENRELLDGLLSRQFSEAIQVLTGGRATTADIRLRGQLIASHLLGIGISRYVMRFAPLADVPREELIRRLEPVMSAYLTEAPPIAGS